MIYQTLQMAGLDKHFLWNRTIHVYHVDVE
jgi:hypothetical protein